MSIIINEFKITDVKLKALARMVHEANKAYCETLGDFSQKPWSEAPGYNHESAMVGVRAIVENADITPEDMHNAWMGAKEADGWVYGPTKDWDKKTHPSIVPYEKLTATEQYKDWLVIYVVKSYVDYLKQSPMKAPVT